MLTPPAGRCLDQLLRKQMRALIAPGPKSGYSCKLGDFTQHLGTTSSTAQGDGGSFNNRKPIGAVGCCESRMAERTH